MPLFGRKNETRVPYNYEIASKCICPTCPVQKQSTCTQPKIQKLLELKKNLTSNPKIVPEKMPNPKDMPGMYCSTGTAACKDLDNQKPCICYQCEVHKEYYLKDAKPIEHYCFNDRAI